MSTPVPEEAPAERAGAPPPAHQPIEHTIEHTIQHTIPHRVLRSALEFAVTIAAEGQKRRPPLPIPASLRPHLNKPRLPASSLGPVRRIIDSDDVFRTRLAAGATPELVDEVGLLWLHRPEGWEARIAGLVERAARRAEDDDARAALRRAEKRREAAELVAARTRAELVDLRERLAAVTAELHDRRADVAKLVDAVAELRAELIDTRNDVRHANDRAAAAARRAEAAEAARLAAVARVADAEGVRDDVLADRAASSSDAATVAALAALAQDIAAQLAALAEPDAATAAGRRAGPARERRRPLSIPGGVLGDSDAATSFLLRSGATVLVDGYNVAKLGWPGLELAEQRRVLLDVAEDAARRHGTDLTVIFDGADVVGAAADQRRLVRVVFSPSGVTADDVIRGEVDRLPASRHVVVVTNDAQIISDVRAAGANHVTSSRFLTFARR
jgi:predicted RNA-binding protein with PIN domain